MQINERIEKIISAIKRRKESLSVLEKPPSRFSGLSLKRRWKGMEN